jgi:hypothetical protein
LAGIASSVPKKHPVSVSVTTNKNPPLKKAQKRKFGDSVATTGVGETGNDGDDEKYCTCQQVSYGEMIACDNKVNF